MDNTANQALEDAKMHTIKFWGEWTLEVTDDRLRDWTDAAIAHRFGIRITEWPHIRAYEEEVGYTYQDLEKAVLGWYADRYSDSAWVIPTNARQTQVQRPRLGSKRVVLGPGFDAGKQKVPKYIDVGERGKA